MPYDRQRAVEHCYLIPGWMWPVELGRIYDMLLDSRLHVEVGTFCGKSLFVSAMAVPDGARVVGVESLVPHQHCPGMDWVAATLDRTVRDARTKRPQVDVSWLRMDHLEAARKLRGQPITSVFLDADHHYAETLAAIETWHSLLRPGGIMLGHDFWAFDDGVMNAVNEFFGERQLKFDVVPETRLWFHVKGA